MMKHKCLNKCYKPCSPSSNIVSSLPVAFIMLCILLFSLPTLSVFAQSNKESRVTIQTLELQSRKLIEFASVAAYLLPDTVLVTGGITDARGKIVFDNLEEGHYVIVSSFVGYNQSSIYLRLNNTRLHIDTVVFLQSATTILDEVEVSAEQINKKSDIEKTSINISRSAASVSGNASDVLRGVAGVRFDADDRLNVRGNNNVLILVDGIPSTVESLNTLPASGIETIEILTSADAKYDAEGTGGIINIITKRNRGSGLGASVQLNYGHKLKANGGVSISMKSGIWDMRLSYNGRYHTDYVESSLNRFFRASSLEMEQEALSTQRNFTDNILAQFAATPSKKHRFDIGVSYSAPRFYNNQTIGGFLNGAEYHEYSFVRTNNILFSRRNIETSLSYTFSPKPTKQALIMGSSFSRTRGNRPASYSDDGLLQRSEGGGTPTNFTVSGDYYMLFAKNLRFETGYKYFRRWNNFEYYFYDFDTSINTWLLNNSFSNNLEHCENIHSVYAMCSDSIGGSLFYKAGIRIEYNTSVFIQRTLYDSIYNSWVYPFPFIMLNYKLDENQNMAFVVNRRITRPRYPQLNPFINVIDRLTYETGNRNLIPELANKLELSYSLTKKKLQLKTAVFASFTENFIIPVSIFEYPDKLIISFANCKLQARTGADIDVRIACTKWLQANSVFSAYFAKTSGMYLIHDLSSHDFAYTLNTSIVLKPLKNTELHLMFNYQSESEMPQFIFLPVYYTDIALRRSFLDRRLQISLSLTDVFDTRRWQVSGSNVIYDISNNSHGETRIVWIGLNYSFNTSYQMKSSMARDADDNGGVIKLGQ